MLTINISELILTVINFFLLLFLLKRFLYTPLITFMDERRGRIEQGFVQEQEALAAVQKKELEADIQRKECLDAARVILSEAQIVDEKHHMEVIAQAKADTIRKKEEAKKFATEANRKESLQLSEHKDRLADLLAKRLLCAEN